MGLPDHVEHYATPMGRVNLEVHTQPTGNKNYWLFSSVAAIELHEEDIGPLGDMLKSYHEEAVDRNQLWLKWILRLLCPAVFIFIGYTIGAA